MTTLLQDLRYALRQLRRMPGFAMTAVLTLALGIGANTAIFSLLDQALLRSLPVRDPASLVVLKGTGKVWQGSVLSSGGDVDAYFSYPMFLDLESQAHDLAGVIGTAPATVGFSRNGSSELANVELVSGNYFSVLGVSPAVGRLFTPQDDLQPKAAPLAVLSYDYWRNHLGANPSVINSTVSLNGQPFQIVGVSAPGFESAVWGQTPNLFVPMHMMSVINPGTETRLTDRTTRWMNVLGRLAPGVTREQADAANAPLWHNLRADELKRLGSVSKRFPIEFMKSQLLFTPGSRGFSYTRDTYQTPFAAVMAMALLVLLIASVNVASLLLVRAAGRVREFSLRSALGAGRGRIVAQLLMEGMLIGVLGGALGLLLAPVALRALVSRLADATGATAFSAGVDLRVLLFNFAIAILVSLVFSLVPALQLRRMNLTSTLRESSGTGAGGMVRLRRAIVCLQVGLSVLLLIGAGLFVRTLERLREVNVGFTTAHLITFAIDPTLAGFTVAESPAVQRRVYDALAAIPGVESVAATNDPELAGNSFNANVSMAGFQTGPDDRFTAESGIVTEDYASAMGIPLVAGRFLAATDDAAHPNVLVINQSFANHFCHGSAQACLGRRVGFGNGNTVPQNLEVVGVVADNKHMDMRTPAGPAIFLSLRQHPEVSNVTLYVRTLADPAAIVASIRRVMQQTEPRLALPTLITMDQQIDLTLQNDRLIALLAVSFGMLATLLAGVGLYGVLAFATAQRTREIGIRMALGSSRVSVAGLILGDVLKLAAIGVAIAVPMAVVLGRLVASQLFGVSAADPVILISVVALISAVAVVAALLPARRAASVNPTIALRTE